jgi:outer membrane receptor protein involved in Fe transport
VVKHRVGEIYNGKEKNMSRMRIQQIIRALCALCSICCLAAVTPAQSSVATLSGAIIDEQGRTITGVTVTLVNSATSQQRAATSNAEGNFTFPQLAPGAYKLTAHREGFATTEVNNIILNVGDQSSLSVELKIAQVNAAVTVKGDVLLTNESPAVATVVDRKFVENLPLNGRSFQTLIGLSPGVVFTPIISSSIQGQFSVNGQRTNTNNFQVDGVSANFGLAPTASLYDGAGGAVPSLSAVGGTSSLVSVDAVQEFAIQTSTYAPEFGRQPGAQVSIVSRSGTNQYHGGVFNYLRNDALDASNFFANANGLKKPALRQNDFGFTLGGPLTLPKRVFGPFGYEARDRTFFFLSYEGLRLVQPVISRPLRVPSLEARQNATGVIRDLMNAYPLPTSPGPASAPTEAIWVGGFSNRSSLNATAIRIDHKFSQGLTIFARYNNAPSENNSRNVFTPVSSPVWQPFETKTLTAGATMIFTTRVVNDLRVNFSRGRSGQYYSLDNFGGAIVPPDSVLFPSFTSADDGSFGYSVGGTDSQITVGKLSDNFVRQFNITDNLSWTHGNHTLKFGLDYRRLVSDNDLGSFSRRITFGNVAQLATGVATGASIAATDFVTHPVYHNFSVYAQDTWRPARRLTLTYGLRYDVNPAPVERDGNQPRTITDLNNLAAATLAPPGTRLYETTWNNIAPRVGMAYQLSAGRGTMLRGGFGVFYDLGYGFAAQQSFIPTFYPLGRRVNLVNQPFTAPILSAQPPPNSPNPPYPQLFAYDRGYKLPYSLQYNLTVEQPFGANVVSVAYVGSAGKRLARLAQLRNPTPDFTILDTVSNDSIANYNSLQLEFQRRLARRWQALASYTYSKSIDTVSDETLANYQIRSPRYDPEQDRGPSAFDVRHSFNAAVGYDAPSPFASGVGKAIFGGFGLDFLYRARTGMPVNIVTGQDLLGFGLTNVSRPDHVPGQPLYLNDPAAPGGRVFNRAAFDAGGPANERRQGTLGRNVLRGFGMSQFDLALRRQFNLTERANLQFRLDVFNLFNQANFANPIGILTDTNFGRATQTLNTGLGGLNSAYQIGGPRSLQASLKLNF